jgi:hypothetical protein
MTAMLFTPREIRRFWLALLFVVIAFFVDWGMKVFAHGRVVALVNQEIKRDLNDGKLPLGGFSQEFEVAPFATYGHTPWEVTQHSQTAEETVRAIIDWVGPPPPSPVTFLLHNGMPRTYFQYEFEDCGDRICPFEFAKMIEIGEELYDH